MTAPFSMIFPAQLTLASPITYEFDAVQFSEGSPQDVVAYEPQLIVSPSVNMSRMRNNRYDFPEFSLVAFASKPTFDDALADASAYRGVRGFYCTLSVIMQDITYAYGGRKFYILRATARPVPGPFIGGSSEGALAHVIAQFSLKGTA